MAPPKSPYGLIQESVYDDPWKVFVVCIFCNLTRRVESEPFMWQFFGRWPTAVDASRADPDEIAQMIESLGLANRRANTLVRMSQDYLNKDWSVDPRCLYGVGSYAYDAYMIFCKNQWMTIHEPKDGALKKYWRWVNNVE
jgi:methyl-CpG-binding domain protein 4